MLINETKYDVDAFKNFSAILGAKSRFLIALIQLLIFGSGVLICVLNKSNEFVMVLGGVIAFGALVALVYTFVNWRKMSSKQVDKVANQNPYFNGSMVAKYEVDEENETIGIVMDKDEKQINSLTMKIFDLVKVIPTKDFIFLFVNAKQCLIMNKASMIEGEFWEIEFLFKKILGDRYIDKNIDVK